MFLHFDRIWQASLWRFVALMAIAIIIGVELNALIECVLIFFSTYLLIIFWQLRKLYLWLQTRRRKPPPLVRGIWKEIYQRLTIAKQADFLKKRVLLERLKDFRKATVALPDAIIVLDRSQHIVWFNKSAKRLLGLNYPHDIGGYFPTLIHLPRVADWLKNKAATEPLTDIPSPVDDNIRLGLRFISYSSEQSLLIARDISNVMRLEQVRRDFVANVSHELRTPLTVVHGYLDLLEPDQIPEWEPILKELRTQSRRMAQIVEDLLTLSRLEAQDNLIEEHVAMRSLLTTLQREAEALSQGKHQVKLERTNPYDLRGSSNELHSAFSNLVSNAVRYTPPGGSITIRWCHDETGASFSVSDTGQGIAPEFIPRITERFYRISTSRSRESGGTGLGLSIVKHVLMLHHAKLEIESKLGAGSTFRCRFDSNHLLEPEKETESQDL